MFCLQNLPQRLQCPDRQSWKIFCSSPKRSNRGLFEREIRKNPNVRMSHAEPQVGGPEHRAYGFVTSFHHSQPPSSSQIRLRKRCKRQTCSTLIHVAQPSKRLNPCWHCPITQAPPPVLSLCLNLALPLRSSRFACNCVCRPGISLTHHMAGGWGNA